MGKSFWVAVLFTLVVHQAIAAPTVDLQLLAPNLDNVTSIANAGDGSGRLFLMLQGGRVMMYDGTCVLTPPFLDIRSMVLSNASERGLLGIAFHPGYATNGQFYVFFTALDTSNVVARFTASPPGASTVNTNTMMTVIRLPHPGADNHNGGQLQFGPDGYLYVGPGDGGPGSGCDPANNAQNLGSPLGKLLRLDVSNFSTNYTIPPGNPFIATNGALPEIWAYGLRNPWRFSFDRATGDLFIADVGQSTAEEVDFQPAGSPGGQNYGWRLYEGFCTNCCSVTFSNVPTALPIFDYGHVNGACAIMGGYRYRGSKIPPLAGTYVYGDNCSGQIWGATQNVSSVWGTGSLFSSGFNISTFGEDEDGELYVAKYAASVGAIYRIIWRDTDGDGLPDDWERQFGLSTNNVADASIDTDHDGLSNRQEFLAGTNPTNANDFLRIAGVQKLDSTNVLISFTSSPGKKYNLERSPNLSPGAWSTMATNVAGTGGIVQVTNVVVNPATQRFYRVRLAQGNAAAADDASDPSYTGGWATGSNGGTGFGPWTLTGSGVLGSTTNGYFIGSSLNNASGAGPGIDVAGKSWGIYANSANFTAAYRAFATGSLAVGQTFSLNMDNGLIDAGQPVGFTIRNGNATTGPANYNTGARFEFSFVGPSPTGNYKVMDAAGSRDTGVPYTGTGVRLAFTLTGADTYSLLITDNATGATTTITGTLAGSGSLDSFALYNRNAGVGSLRDVFFNALRVSLFPVP